MWQAMHLEIRIPQPEVCEAYYDVCAKIDKHNRQVTFLGGNWSIDVLLGAIVLNTPFPPMTTAYWLVVGLYFCIKFIDQFYYTNPDIKCPERLTSGNQKPAR